MARSTTARQKLDMSRAATRLAPPAAGRILAAAPRRPVRPSGCFPVHRPPRDQDQSGSTRPLDCGFRRDERVVPGVQRLSGLIADTPVKMDPGRVGDRRVPLGDQTNQAGSSDQVDVEHLILGEFRFIEVRGVAMAVNEHGAGSRIDPMDSTTSFSCSACGPRRSTSPYITSPMAGGRCNRANDATCLRLIVSAADGMRKPGLTRWCRPAAPNRGERPGPC